jgi:DAK2 domain fusion protein YloV
MKTLNGTVFKRMILSGAYNLFNHYPEIDALNVFPVPDGDTGTNMNLTISSGAKEVSNLGSENLYDVARCFSKGMLMGARGNSGVILSQIFRGFAQGVEGKEKIGIEELGEAFSKGVETTYKAVLKPVEGTILTVIRESTEKVNANISKLNSIEQFFNLLLDEARASLQRTPDLLPILKEVGVIDSGGAGLVLILEGFDLGLRNKVVQKKELSDFPTVEEQKVQTGIKNEEFGYCTEFILRLEPQTSKYKNFVQKYFEDAIQRFGNSAVVVHDEDLVKVHVHTLKPGEVLNYAQDFGSFIKLKIENMQEQHNQIIVDEGKKAHTLHKEKYGLIAISAGEGISRLFKDYSVTELITGGQTMNPSAEDFVNAIAKVNAENIFLFPNNSNIILAAEQAKELAQVEGKNIIIIPTTTIIQGLTATMMFNPEASPTENLTEMEAAISRVKSGSITISIRDTEIDSVKIKQNQHMALFNKKIVYSGENRLDVLIHLVDSMIDEKNGLVLIIKGDGADELEAEQLTEYINSKYSVDVVVEEGNQPVYSYYIGVE